MYYFKMRNFYVLYLENDLTKNNLEVVMNHINDKEDKRNVIEYIS